MIAEMRAIGSLSADEATVGDVSHTESYARAGELLRALAAPVRIARVAGSSSKSSAFGARSPRGNIRIGDVMAPRRRSTP